MLTTAVAATDLPAKADEKDDNNDAGQSSARKVGTLFSAATIGKIYELSRRKKKRKKKYRLLLRAQLLLRSLIIIIGRSSSSSSKWGGVIKFVVPLLFFFLHADVVAAVFLLLTNLTAYMSRQISVLIMTITVNGMSLLLLCAIIKFLCRYLSSPSSASSNKTKKICCHIDFFSTFEPAANDVIGSLLHVNKLKVRSIGKHHRRKTTTTGAAAKSRVRKAMLLFSMALTVFCCFPHSCASAAVGLVTIPPITAAIAASSVERQQKSDEYDGNVGEYISIHHSDSNNYLPVYYPSLIKNLTSNKKVPAYSIYQPFSVLSSSSPRGELDLTAAASALDIADTEFDSNYPYVVQQDPPKQQQFYGPAMQHKSIITIGGLFPMTPSFASGGGGGGGGGGGLVEAAQLALQHVNRHATVLPEHELRMDTVDTTCDPGVGVSMFLRLLHQRPRKVMIFGGVCSNVTDPIAQSVLYWNITQLTYGDTHPKYSEDWQTRYSNFFQIVPNENSFNDARIALLRHFKWHKIGTIYQYKPRFVLPHNDLLKQLSTVNVQVNVTVSFLDELKDQLDRMKEHNIRIIVGFFDELSARQIFCRAYHIGLYGRRYQWIVPGEYASQWYNSPVTASGESGGSSAAGKFSCTREQLLEAIDGYISVDVLSLSTDDEQPTICEITPSEFNREFKEQFGSSSSLSKYYGYAYDGIWAIALAIQSVQEFLRRQVVHDASGSLLMTIENDFSYRNERWGSLFRSALRNVTFDGVTGHVKFHHHSRVGLITIRQLQLAGAAAAGDQTADYTSTYGELLQTSSANSADEVKVAEYNANTGVLNFSRRVAPIAWKTSKPPKAEPRIVEEHRYIYPPVFVSMSVLAVLGIVVAVIFLCINIRYRNHRYIKMSSPYLNNLIVIGAIFAYIAVILFGLDSSTVGVDYVHHVCAARVWVLSMGFTLAFGSMFSKTYRVNAIFTNVKLSRKVIKDYKLFIMVGVLVLIDASVLSIWQFQFPFIRAETRSRPEEDPETADIVIPIIESCESISPQYMKVFNFIVLSYKGLLLIFACFLAWSTRKVSIPALNDSKYIGLSVYNIVIFCTTGTAIAFVLEEDQQNYRILILSSFIIFCTTATLMLVFMPKVLELRRNPRADAHSRRVRATLKTVRRERKNSISDEMDLRMRQLGEKNQKLRDQLLKKTRELDKLSRKLSTASITLSITPSKVANNIHPHNATGASTSDQHFNPSSSTTGDSSTARSSEQPQQHQPQHRQSLLLLRPSATSSGDYRTDYELTSQTLESSTLLQTGSTHPDRNQTSSDSTTKNTHIFYNQTAREHEKLQNSGSILSNSTSANQRTTNRRPNADDDEDEDAAFSGASIESEQLVGGSAKKSAFVSPIRRNNSNRIPFTSTNLESSTSSAATPPNVSAFSARRLSHFVSNIASHFLPGGGGRRSPSIRSASVIIVGGSPAAPLVPREPLLTQQQYNATSLNVLTNNNTFRRTQPVSDTINQTTTFISSPPNAARSARQQTTYRKNSEIDDDDDESNFGGVYVGAPAPSMGYRPRRSPPPAVLTNTPASTTTSSTGGFPPLPNKRLSICSNDDLSSPMHNLTADVNVPLARSEDLSPNIMNTGGLSYRHPMSADSTSTMLVVGMPTVLVGSGAFVPAYMMAGQRSALQNNNNNNSSSTRLSPLPLLDNDSHIDFMSSFSDEEAAANGHGKSSGMPHEYENEDSTLRRVSAAAAVVQQKQQVQLVPGVMLSSSSSLAAATAPTAANTIVAEEFKTRKLLAGGKQPDLYSTTDIIFLLNGGRKSRSRTAKSSRKPSLLPTPTLAAEEPLLTVSAAVATPDSAPEEQVQSSPKSPIKERSWLARILTPKSKQSPTVSPPTVLRPAPSRAAAARLSGRRLPPRHVAARNLHLPHVATAPATVSLGSEITTLASTSQKLSPKPNSVRKNNNNNNNGEDDLMQVIKIHCDYEAHV